MTAVVDWATGFLAGSPLLVVLLVFLLAASEAVLVVGAVVPGTTVILALAAAAGASGQGVVAMTIGAFLGAVAGDGVSFWIGRRYGPALARWGPLARRPQLLASGERAVRERGASSVFVARFLPAVRAVVPVAAGMLGMDAVRFTVANVASAAVWAAAQVLLPALGGGALAALGGGLAVVLVGVILVAGLALWLVRLLLRLAGGRLIWVRGALHAWASRREGRAARALARTLDPDDPSVLFALVWAALLVAASVGFIGLAEDVAGNEAIVEADLAISRFVQDWRTAWLDRFMIIITMLGDGPVIATVAGATALWLAWQRLWRTLAAFALGIALSTAFVPFTKSILNRARPLTDLYTGADSFSFPSGHATSSAVLFGFLAVLLAGSLTRPWRVVALATLATLVLLIAFSRVYLQADRPSDVAAGLAFGVALSAAFALARGHALARPAALSAVAATALVLAAAVHVPRGLSRAEVVYAPRDLSVAMSSEQWRAGGWRDVAPGRIDFSGEVETPFLLQWAGDPAPLGALLEANGWARADGWSLAAVRKVFGRVPPQEVPPAPQLHLGRSPVAVWTRPADGAPDRLVFRLWPSDFSVDGTRLLVGALEAERIVRPLGLVSLPLDQNADGSARRMLQARLRTGVDPTRLLLPPFRQLPDEG